ncbi:hypothetical protein QBC40DRAFT_169170 [Triangularia verruculosa]|uniref:Uncharacterized protein n=1 Tax=Triangularia verruculosa TaxID=2587418 RepID=A0AAN6XNJ5_9PEZI|nr:hypothetical protein QBC40DRAFT_169170 [Triangularia verruculosa]
MSSPLTPEQIRQLSEQAQEFRPVNTFRRPSTFLSLAPSTSESYPRNQQPKGESAPLTAEALAAVPQQQDEQKRRASSLSSDASKFRFLKLGPVHWGEHQDGVKEDFYEVAVEE